MKKQFLILFAFISVLALSQVPQRFNKVIVTGDITSPKFIKTGSTADSVLLGNGSARAISTIKTDTVSLSNRVNAKAAGNGTANGTNTGDETLTSIKTKLGAATAVSDGYLKYQDWNTFNSKEPAITKNTAFNKNFGTTPGTVLEGRTFGTAANSAVGDFQPIENQRLSTTNSPSFSSITSTVSTGTAPLTVNSTTMVENLNADLLDGKHSSAFQPTITGLSTNYVPKWNGSSFVNSGIYNNSYWGTSITNGIGAFADYAILGRDNSAILYNPANTNNTVINSTTQSTSPTTGALVVNGGVGADHVRANNFYGNGSNLTGVQRPITLTTNGTSGAATFSGNVLNVPNYAASGGVNQAQTTVNGSTSGTMVCSMPFQTGSYKKVIIYLTNLVGTAEYIFPVQFVGGASKRIITTNVTVGTSGSFPDDRVNITATSGSGTITIEGY